MKKHPKFVWLPLAVIPLLMGVCNDDEKMEPATSETTITIENVLDSKPLVQSGTFENDGAAPVVMPGESLSLQFYYAAKGQAVSFATMYGLSNDLFFAPENPGIALYNDEGIPIEGDVSQHIKLWDNGTRVNEMPGPAASHPGVAESELKGVMEVDGMDAQVNDYASASSLMHNTLAYEGNSMFTLTIKNTSGNTPRVDASVV